MKIVAGRREDILKEKEEWQKNYDAQKAEYEEQHEQFREAYRKSLQPIKDAVEAVTSKYDALDFDIYVDRSYERAIELRVQCNEHRVHDETSALSWDLRVVLSLETMDVKKESSSWSGLNATTPENLESLKQTYECLVELNKIDYQSLLNVVVPEYSQYVTKRDPAYGDKPNFDQQLRDLDIEEKVIGKDAVMEIMNIEQSGFRGNKAWVQILSETPSMYNVRFFWGGHNEDQVKVALREAIDRNAYSQRVRKTSIHPTNPLRIVEV